MGEEKMSLYSSMIPSTCFYCKERLCVEVMNVVTTIYLLQAWITKKTNFPICEMALLHCLAKIKEIAVGSTTSGILYNCLPKVIITLRGLDSYIACRFHKYGWPKRTSQTSRGAISQYLVSEGLDVVGQMTLLADMEISSLVKPTNGVGLRVRYYRQVQPLDDLC